MVINHLLNGMILQVIMVIQWIFVGSPSRGYIVLQKVMAVIVLLPC